MLCVSTCFDSKQGMALYWNPLRARTTGASTRGLHSRRALPYGMSTQISMAVRVENKDVCNAAV